MTMFSCLYVFGFVTRTSGNYIHNRWTHEQCWLPCPICSLSIIIIMAKWGCHLTYHLPKEMAGHTWWLSSLISQLCSILVILRRSWEWHKTCVIQRNLVKIQLSFVISRVMNLPKSHNMNMTNETMQKLEKQILSCVVWSFTVLLFQLTGSIQMQMTHVFLQSTGMANDTIHYSSIMVVQW